MLIAGWPDRRVGGWVPQAQEASASSVKQNKTISCLLTVHEDCFLSLRDPANPWPGHPAASDRF